MNISKVFRKEKKTIKDENEMKIVLRFPPEREKSILISLWAKTNGIHTADFFGQLYVEQYFEAAISPKLSL